jgi:hypothetical protein
VSAKVRAAAARGDGPAGRALAAGRRLHRDAARLSVRGTLTSPLRLDLDARRAELPAVAGQLELTGQSIPRRTQATLRGSTRADWGAQSVSADLAVALDGSPVDATLPVASWTRPVVSFSVVADRLDMTRYFPLATSPPGEGGAPRPAAARPPAAGRRPRRRSTSPR